MLFQRFKRIGRAVEQAHRYRTIVGVFLKYGYQDLAQRLPLPSALRWTFPKTRTEQETLTARAQVAKAQAQAEAQIAAARGQADSIRIINEALAANPRYVELKAVEKWDGKLPQVTGSATPFVTVPQSR